MIDGRSILSTIVQSSAVELFHGYGVAVAPLALGQGSPGVPANPAFVSASIAFASPVMTGSLALQLPSGLLALVRAAMGVSPKEIDMIRELANQLAGRVKNRLLIYQIELRVGLPTATTPTLGTSSREEKVEKVDYVFRFLRGEFYVQLRGKIDYSKIVYLGHRDTASEGDVILF